MPRDANGVYSLPLSYLATEGTPIQPAQHNEPLTDIAAALTGSLPRNGLAPMTGDLNMGGNKLVNVSNVVRADAAQSFNDTQKAQARANIGAFGGNTSLDIFGGTVGSQYTFLRFGWSNNVVRQIETIEPDASRALAFYDASSAFIGGLNFSSGGAISYIPSSGPSHTFWHSISLPAPARLDQANAFQANITRTGAAGTSRSYLADTGGSPRWEWGADFSAESGGNAGSNFFLNSFTDGGAYFATPFFVDRATSVVSFGVTPSVAGAPVWHSGNLPAPLSANTAWNGVGSTVYAYKPGAPLSLGGTIAGTGIFVAGLPVNVGTWMYTSPGANPEEGLWRRIA